jgi:PhnB protein
MVAPGMENKVMHSALRIGQSTVMASDGRCGDGGAGPKFDGFSLSLDAASDADAQRLFAALSDGGTVTMPLGKTFFAKQFGLVSDRFGVSWMVIAQ